MSFLRQLLGIKENQLEYSFLDYNKYFKSEIIDDTPIELFNLGELNLPTGKIIACDPLVYIYNAEPFTKTVSPGVYPVTVCVAKTKNSGDRYALVKLQFSSETAIKWEMALLRGQDVKELKQDEDFFGFGVDAGLGCFCDVEAKNFYKIWNDDFEDKNPGKNIYDDFFADEFRKNAKDPNDINDIGDWLNFKIPSNPDLNIIMFHSGYGDGMYPCYWGITKDGNICSLIVDFIVFE